MTDDTSSVQFADKTMLIYLVTLLQNMCSIIFRWLIFVNRLTLISYY
jgi:hypothetical protein